MPPQHGNLAQHVAIQLIGQRRIRDVAENANEWIWEVDQEGQYTYASPVVRKVLGYEPEQVQDRPLCDLFHPEDRKELTKQLMDLFARKTPFRELIARHVHRNGRPVWLAMSGVPVLSRSGDLVGYRGASAIKFEDASVVDPLTEVYNRHGLYLLAKQYLSKSALDKTPVAVVFCDMDDLKKINDRFGHAEGDLALRRVARILVDSVRDSDIVARYGGDEFVVLFAGLNAKDVERDVIGRIEESIRAHNLGHRDYSLSVSIGCAIDDHVDLHHLDELILRADEAMYIRKRSRR